MTLQAQVDELDQQLTAQLELFARRLDELEQDVKQIQKVLHTELAKTPR